MVFKFLAKKGFGKAFLKNQDTTIKSVKPNPTKGDSLKVLRHKTKMSFKKATDDITDAITTGKDKIIKSLGKMKDTKK